MLSLTISLLALTSYYGIMGLFVGTVVLTPIVSTRAFPPAIRYSSLSFAYNIAYAIFVGLTPISSSVPGYNNLTWLPLTMSVRGYFGYHSWLFTTDVIKDGKIINQQNRTLTIISVPLCAKV